MRMAPFVICGKHDIPSRRAVAFELEEIGPDGGARPLSVVIARWGAHVFAYRNVCPHHNSRLDWERGQFLDSSGARLMCGKHGALFDLQTGACIEGPCFGQGLQPIEAAILDDDICLLGVALVQDEDDHEAPDFKSV